MIRRPPRSTQSRSSAASDVYKRQVYVDGSSVGALTEVELKDRRILGEEGFISIFAVVDSATGRVVAGPHIQARGFAEDDAVFEEILPQIKDALEAVSYTH